MMKREQTMRIEREKGRVKVEREAGGRRDLAQNLKRQIYFEIGEKYPKGQGRNRYADVEYNQGIFLVIISKFIK